MSADAAFMQLACAALAAKKRPETETQIQGLWLVQELSSLQNFFQECYSIC